MTRALLSFLILAVVLGPTASAQVETLWERTVPNQHPDWFGTNTERGMAYGVVDGNARVFVASRSEAPNRIRILDATNGQDVGSLSSAGVSGGSFGFLLNDVAVSSDGVIFASNMVESATADTPFRIYRWDDEDQDPVIAVNFTEGTGLRLGDRITVAGSVSDNTIAIYAAQANQNRVVRFTTEDQGESFASEIIMLDGITTTGIFPNVAPLVDGSGDFYYNASGFNMPGIHPRLHEANGSFVATLSSIPSETNTTVYFEAGGRSYLAVNDGGVEENMSFSIYEVTGGGASARFVVRTPEFGNVANTFAAGDLDVVVNEDGSIILFGLQANNGIAAFQIDLAAIFEGTFYVGAEGSAPGGANPDFASLSEAFAEINDREASGAITLLVTSELDERGNHLAISSRPFTEQISLTIRPAPGTQPTIYVSGATADEVGAEGAGAGILIDNTSWVTIDGSNEVDGTSRDLTIVVDDEAATRGIQAIRDAQYVTIQNLRLLQTAADPGVVGIRVRRDNDATVAPENLLIQNNQIGAEDAPFFQSVALFGTTGLPVQADVIGNDIYASQRAITTFWVVDSEYTGNRIWVLGTTPTTSWSAGIYLANGDAIRIVGNEVLGFTTHTATAQSNAAFLFNVNLGDVWAYNNMVAVPEFSNQGEATDNPFYGFGVNNALGVGRHFIYHNTVRVGDSDQTGRIAALGFDVASTAQEFELVNNIFVTDVDSPNAFVYHWPMASMDLFESNYNVLFASGASGRIGLRGETAYSTLQNWQFGTGFDPNSVSKAVEFVSDTDLRLTGESIGDEDLAGTPLAAVTVDIDGTPRSETAPYKGAFEAEPLVSTEDPVASLPESFELHQNYPNPFSNSTTISYTLRNPGFVTVRIYNTAGQLVRQVVDDYQPEGRQEVRVDMQDLASGVYIYRMQFEDRAQTMRMVLVR